MENLICDFEGWFKIGLADVKLIHLETGEIASAKDIIEKYGSIEGCDLEDFSVAFKQALDGVMGACNLSIEKKED